MQCARYKRCQRPILPDDNEGFLAIGIDITFVRELERRVQLHGRRSRKILESCPDTIVAYDINGLLVYANRAYSDVFGWGNCRAGRATCPFFTTKEVGQGIGQGLAITHDVITHKHKGIIFFETETGKGTTFTIALPQHR